MEQNCVFCRSIHGDGRIHPVYEDDRTVAFLDIHPVTEGHTLVAPRAHHETLTDAPAEVVAATFRTARRVGAGIEAHVDPDGLTVVQSNGTAAGQDVFHLHVHLIPRYEGDGITFAPGRRDLAPEDGERVAEGIRQEL